MNANPQLASSFMRSRSLRRAVVITTYLSYLLLVSFWAPAKALGAVGWLLVVGALGIVTLGSYGILVTSQYSTMTSQKRQELDERQRQVSDQAFRTAYLVLSFFAAFLALYVYIAADSGSFWLPQSGAALTAFFWGVLLIASTLPTSIPAWTELEPLA